MADSSAEAKVATPNSDNKKVKKAATAKKPAAKPTHPPTSEMVNKAIENLKERGGSSLIAIKKYLATTYKVDANKVAPFIKKYVKGAVASGKLIQTKGKGASGSFKLPVATKAKSGESKKPSVKSVEKKVKKDKAAKAEKKPKTPKKAAEKKKSAAATAKTAKKTGTVKAKAAPKQKPTKPSKAGVKAAKSPKPKKIPTTTKKVAAKKPAKK